MATAFIVYGVFIIALVTAAVIWGLKNNQFEKQGSASRLPLEVDEPGNTNSEK